MIYLHQNVMHILSQIIELRYLNEISEYLFKAFAFKF